MDKIIAMTGNPTATARIAATDAAQNFTAAQVENVSKSVVGALITCEDNAVRFALGTGGAPTQGASPVGHLLSPGGSVKLSNSHQVKTFSFINAVNGSDGALQVTFEF